MYFSTEIIRWARIWADMRADRAGDWAQVNTESLRRRTEAYIKDGRLSLATNTLEVLDNMRKGNPPPAQRTPQQIQTKVEELHPRGDARDILPEEADDPPVHECIKITPQQVQSKFHRLKTDSGSGNTGWTNSLLKIIGDDRDLSQPNFNIGLTQPSRLHTAFAALANRIYSGAIKGEARVLLNTARLILVPKEGGGDRPITVHCALQRLIGGLANEEARRTLGEYLRPEQLGGGFKCGAEIMARDIAMAYENGEVILLADIGNAFNSARRRNMFDQVLLKVPGLARYFRFQYGEPEEGFPSGVLRNNTGQAIIQTETGVGQGHPCSPLYFELGIHRALVELSEKVTELEAAYNQAHDAQLVHTGAVKAYEDDTVIHGEAPIMLALAPLLVDHFAFHGFSLKIEKSQIVGKGTADMELPEGFKSSPEGRIALGVPIGTPAYCQARAREKLEAMAPPTGSLPLLRARSGILLLGKCFGPRATYMLRAVLDLKNIADEIKAYDTRFITAIAGILNLQVTPELRTRIGLPRSLGGLGHSPHHGMASEANQIASRLHYINYLTLYHPTKTETTHDKYTSVNVIMGALEDREELPGGQRRNGPQDLQGTAEDRKEARGHSDC